MTKLTIHEDSETAAPSQRLLAAAKKSLDITDDLGRKITLRKPAPLDNLDFTKATGGDKLNIDYQLEVVHLKYVGAIDGETVACPANDGELRALYSRLGDEGNEAVRSGMVELLGIGASEEAIKNS